MCSSSTDTLSPLLITRSRPVHSGVFDHDAALRAPHTAQDRTGERTATGRCERSGAHSARRVAECALPVRLESLAGLQLGHLEHEHLPGHEVRLLKLIGHGGGGRGHRAERWNAAGDERGGHGRRRRRRRPRDAAAAGRGLGPTARRTATTSANTARTHSTPQAVGLALTEDVQRRAGGYSKRRAPSARGQRERWPDDTRRTEKASLQET